MNDNSAIQGGPAAKLTPEQVEKLERAIALAKRPGECRYVFRGRPCCVVAQIAVMEGESVATLKEWDGLEMPGIRDTYARTKALRKYPVNLLVDLQFEWDLHCDADRARDEMRRVLSKFAA